MRDMRAADDSVNGLHSMADDLCEVFPDINVMGAGLFFLCAEPGYGQLDAMRACMEHAKEKGANIERSSFYGSTRVSPIASLSRFASRVESIEASGRHCVVLIEDVPPHDDANIRRLAKILTKMREAGAFVFCPLLPESDLLIESCADARSVYSGDLLLMPSSSSGDYHFRLTHGIAPLEAALTADPGAEMFGKPSTLTNGAYSRALAKCTKDHFRATLADEELGRRLALVLLGWGSLDDVAFVVRHADVDDMLWMERAAPFFGVSVAKGSFEVAGIYRDCVFEEVVSWLQSLIGVSPTIALKAAEVLCQRGQYARAAVILRYIDQEEDAVRLVINQGIPLLFAGARVLVEGSMRTAESFPEITSSDAYLYCSLALRLLSGGRRSACVELPEDLTRSAYEGSIDAYRIVQLKNAKDIIAGLRKANAFTARSHLDYAMNHHVIALRRILEGEFLDEYEDMMDSTLRSHPRTLSTSLVCIDYYIACVMLGEIPDKEQRVDFDSACQMLKSVSPKGLGIYCGSVPDVLSVFTGRADELPGTERLITRAEGNGDKVALSVFLMAAALVDLRNGADMRAHARATRAYETAAFSRSGGLASASLFVYTIICSALGKEEATSEQGGGLLSSRTCRPATKDMIRVLEAVKRGHGYDSVMLDKLDWRKAPRGYFWMLNLLVHDSGIEEHRVVRLLPKAWVACLDERMMHIEEAPPVPRVIEVPKSVPASSKQKKTVSICVFGSFAVWVAGDKIAQTALRRRHAKELLALLVLSRGHRITRRQALLAVWGETDYVRGMQRLYESVSQIRRAMHAADNDFEPILSDRCDGTIALNDEVVECDVDQFQREARLAMEGRSAKSAVSHATEAWKLYGNGISLVVNDVTGTMGRRERELEKLYANALCAGATAALGMRNVYLASRLAGEALRVDEQREDAMICLVEALADLGRTSEVDEMERDYRKRVRGGLRRHSEALERAFEYALRANRLS